MNQIAPTVTSTPPIGKPVMAQFWMNPNWVDIFTSRNYPLQGRSYRRKSTVHINKPLFTGKPTKFPTWPLFCKFSIYPSVEDLQLNKEDPKYPLLALSEFFSWSTAWFCLVPSLCPPTSKLKTCLNKIFIHVLLSSDEIWTQDSRKETILHTSLLSSIKKTETSFVFDFVL
jgi:hypothetical protein